MLDSSSDAVSAAYMPRIDHVRKARETNDYQQFYSSGDPLFLGHSPSPAFSSNELSLVPTGFGAISRPIRCLQSNNSLF